MKTADVIWVHPHGKPEQAIEATVDLLSENQRAIALSLHDKPSWVRTPEGKLFQGGGLVLHRGTGKIVMLLHRYEVGPWIDTHGGGHYEIEESKPPEVDDDSAF